MIEITISNDVGTLGPEATAEDLDTYAANLAAVVQREFGEETEVSTGLVQRSQCDRDDVSEFVLEIERSDAWVDVLEGTY